MRSDEAGRVPGGQVQAGRHPKILLLNWRDITNPAAGGAEVHIWKVFGFLASQGWEVHAICARYRGCLTREIVDGIRVWRIATDKTYHLALPLAYAAESRRIEPEFVLEFMNKLPLYSPCFVRRPMASFVHHLFGHSAYIELNRPIADIVRAWEFLVPAVYQRTPIMAGSCSTISELKRLGLPEQNLLHAPYGAETHRYLPGPKSLHPSILYLGRIRAYKGVDHLLRIAPALLKEYPELTIRIAGTGDALPALRGFAANLNLDHRVQFLGYVSEEVKCKLYQESWIMAFPSSKEGFGLTVPEASLSGTPTVGYNVPGLCDSVLDGVTGILTPYGNLEELRGTLCKIIEDSQLRGRLSLEARRMYEGFSWQNAAEATGKLLERLIPEGRSELEIGRAVSVSAPSREQAPELDN